MEHLRRETGASVMLSVYEGGSVITLDQVESREDLRIVSDIGSRLPVFCTSQGKVFLAHMSRAVLEREIPAIPVAMWMEGLKVTPRAMLSRAVAGIRGSSLLLNLPGSEKAARENLAAVIEALEHGLHMIAADVLRMVDANKFAEQIDEWEAFRTEAFEFACDEGFDHPAFTDWVWPDAAAATAADGTLSATQMTAGDNE